MTSPSIRRRRWPRRASQAAPAAPTCSTPRAGFGRHSVPLARAHYRVVGVDRSESLLAEAQRRAGGERWPKLVRTDHRELPFADGCFDAALYLFTSLGNLGDEQDARVVGEIRRVLRPGAGLVIETMHRDLLVGEFHEQDWRLLGEGRLLLEQRTFGAGSGSRRRPRR
jgi:SAM-dependent methyltransferase